MLKIRFSIQLELFVCYVADEDIWNFLNDLLKMFIAAIYTPQYKWLQKEFQKVNRTETPWLIVLMHCPFYSSYVHHYMEGESMRVIYEPWFVQHKVDVVFAGHVHAYERSVSSRPHSVMPLVQITQKVIVVKVFLPLNTLYFVFPWFHS